MPPNYQCVLIGDEWHATQEQATPPPVTRLGAWTICAVWAEFKRGYIARRPTCAVCLAACEKHEARAKPLRKPRLLAAMQRTPRRIE